jgi:CheY-like chemotaxis protein
MTIKRNQQSRALSRLVLSMHVFNIVARRKEILIVEDNNDARDLLAKLINRFGYDAIEADSGREAIGKAVEMHPDLILMDIYLPDITGDKIIARLKANPATRDIPVIITTALLERTARNHALHAGAVEILEKPFSTPTLREVLDRYLTTAKVRRTAASEHD